jgi:hypothetical protein
MNKAIFLLSPIIACICFGQQRAACAFPHATCETGASGGSPAGAPPPGLVHMEEVPESTKALLQLEVPTIHLKESTLPEVARFFERESKRLDPNHLGINIVIITPKDLGYSNGSSPYVIWYSAKYATIADALANVARLFNMKLEIRKDIYIMPTFTNFKTWQKEHQ